MNTKNQPAFPVEVSVDENGNLRGSQTSNFSGFEMGLTKREYFAAKALQGLMVQSIPGSHNSNSEQWNKERAKFAVDMADAVLRALEEK